MHGTDPRKTFSPPPFPPPSPPHDIAGTTAEVRFEIVPSQLTGWRFFHEARTTLHLAAGGVSPTRKTLPGLVTTTLDVCR